MSDYVLLQSVGNAEVAPSNWNDKRSPMLPWLPAARKKRFPVAKRSPKELIVPETSEKVNQDLKGIFGASEGEKDGAEAAKKKRSSDDTALGNNAKRDETSQVMHEHEAMHAHKTLKKRKRDASDGDDEEETENDNGEQSSTRFSHFTSLDWLTLSLHFPSLLLPARSDNDEEGKQRRH